MNASNLDSDTQQIFVIIPVFNEGPMIGLVIEEVFELQEEKEESIHQPDNAQDFPKNMCIQIVIVDDGSSDDTNSIVSKMLDTKIGLHLLRHIVNLGQGAALATGIQYALSNGAQILVTFDADGQHDPADIIRLVAPVAAGEVDVALGSRFLTGAAKIPWPRRVLLKAAVLFTGLTDHIWLSDAHNGLRALSAGAAQKIKITQNRMAHASEIVSEIARLKLRYVEVPVNVRYTEYSRHKGQRASDALNIMIELLEDRLP
jgi:glycosyltransferase involved in cell wall biosynthesis